MKLTALILDTLRSRMKTIVVFMSISAFFLVMATIAALLIDPVSFLPKTQPGVAGAPGPGLDISTVPKITAVFLSGLSGFVHFAALLLSVFATAGVLPATLERGAIDLFLSKPVSRNTLLAGRFLGSTTLVLLNTAFFILGMWLIAGIKTGYWNAAFLTVIPTVTLAFAVIYAAMTALGISTKSSAATIIIVFLHMYILAPVLAAREHTIFELITDPTAQWVINAVYYILPKPGQIGETASTLILGIGTDWMPLWSSIVFGAAMYVLSMLLLRKKDF